MKTSLLLWTCVMFYSHVNAQPTPQSLFDELPQIPGNVCSAFSDTRVKFENDIRAVEMKIEAIQQKEKEERQAEEERCGFNVNVLQDESARMCYIGYSLSSQHGGFLLEALDFYLEELRGAYQWHPSERPMLELGNEDDFR